MCPIHTYITKYKQIFNTIMVLTMTQLVQGSICKITNESGTVVVELPSGSRGWHLRYQLEFSPDRQLIRDDGSQPSVKLFSDEKIPEGESSYKIVAQTDLRDRILDSLRIQAAVLTLEHSTQETQKYQRAEALLKGKLRLLPAEISKLVFEYNKTDGQETQERAARLLKTLRKLPASNLSVWRTQDPNRYLVCNGTQEICKLVIHQEKDESYVMI